MNGLKLMMNETTTAKDTATLAFSAVQNALRESSTRTPQHSQSTGSRQPSVGTGASATIPADEQRTRNGKEAPAMVANDDQPGASARVVGGSGARRTVNLASVGLALSWALLVGAAAASVMGQEGYVFGLTDALMFAALVIFPVCGIFVAAGLLQQQRAVRDTLTTVAQITVRIAEQQREARQNRKSPEDVTGLRALIDDFNSQRDQVVEGAEQVRAAIAASHSGLLADLDTVARRIAATIEESGSHLSHGLRGSGASMANGLSESAEDLLKRLDRQGNDLLTDLDRRLSVVAETLDQRAAAFASTIEARASGLEGTVDEHVGKLVRALDERTRLLGIDLSEKGSGIVAALDRHGEVFESRSQMLATRIEDSSSSFGQTVTAGIDAITGTIDRGANQVAEMVTEQSRQLLSDLKGHAQILADALDGRTQTLSRTLGEGSQQFLDALTERTGRLEAVLGQGTERLESSMLGRSRQVEDGINAATNRLSDVLGDNGQRLLSAIEKHNASFVASANLLEIALDEKSMQFSDVVAQRTRELTETLSERAKLMAETIAVRSSDLSDLIEGHVQSVETQSKQLREMLTERSETFVSSVLSITGDIDSRLGDHARDVETSLSIRTEELERALTVRAEAMASGISARSEDLQRQLNSQALSLDATLAQQTADLLDKAAALTGGMTELALGVGQTISQSLEAHRVGITGELDQKSNRLIASLNDRAEALTSLFATKVQTVEETFGNGHEAIANRLRTGNAELAELLKTGSGQVAQAISGEIEAMVQAIGAGAESTLKNAKDAHAAISASVADLDRDTSEALTRLQGSATTMANLLSSSLQTLRTIELEVATRVDRYADAVRDAAARTEETGHVATRSITEIQQVTSGTLAEFREVLGILEAEALSLERAAAHLDRTGSMTLGEIDNRRGAIEALATSFTARLQAMDQQMEDLARRVADNVTAVEKRVEDGGVSVGTLLEAVDQRVRRSLQETASAIDTSLTGTTGRLDESLAGTTQRIQAALETSSKALQQALGRGSEQLEEALESTSHRVATQLGSFTDTAATEGQRASAALRRVQHSMIEEMQHVLDTATRGFEDAIETVRANAIAVLAGLEPRTPELFKSGETGPHGDHKSNLAVSAGAGRGRG